MRIFHAFLYIAEKHPLYFLGSNFHTIFVILTSKWKNKCVIYEQLCSAMTWRLVTSTTYWWDYDLISVILRKLFVKRAVYLLSSMICPCCHGFWNWKFYKPSPMAQTHQTACPWLSVLAGCFLWRRIGITKKWLFADLVWFLEIISFTIFDNYSVFSCLLWWFTRVKAIPSLEVVAVFRMR